MQEHFQKIIQNPNKLISTNEEFKNDPFVGPYRKSETFLDLA